MNDILFTIVVPTYNRADFITKTLHSLLIQVEDGYEIIIVDDGSTDNTEEVVKPFLNNKVTYYKKNNAERAAARNFGAQHARGKYVNFFDSDDIALNNHISEAKNIVNSKNQPEWFHLGYAWAYPDGRIFKDGGTFTRETLNDLLPSGNRLSCNGVFIRKDIILANPFNEDRQLSASEDFELWLRLAARYPLYYTNTVTSHVIDHDMRSVRTINGQKLINRLHLLIHYLERDEKVQEVFKKEFVKTRLDASSYIALHLASEPKQKLRGINYLFKSIAISPAILTKKRFYAIIKTLITKW